MKATAIAPSNIAFIKYWGKHDEDLRIPLNGSVSMNLSNLLTTTTVEFSPHLRQDIIRLRHSGDQAKPRQTWRMPETSESLRNLQGRGDSGQARMTGLEIQRIVNHLDRIRSLAKINARAKVVSVNNFPSSTGLSSSASGFAALTLAAAKAAGLSLSEKELSILARLGSGSACRSVPDGFVEWLDGRTNEASYAVSLYSPGYWDIVDVIVIVSKEKKDVPTTKGQRYAKTSPFFPVRLQRIKEKIKLIKNYIKEKNFTAFGNLIEQEALELHSIMLTSNPPLIYWQPETLRVMHAVEKWRQEGLQVYFTVNTGQDIHLICQKKDIELVSKKTSGLPEVKNIVINTPVIGAHTVTKHLI